MPVLKNWQEPWVSTHAKKKQKAYVFLRSQLFECFSPWRAEKKNITKIEMFIFPTIQGVFMPTQQEKDSSKRIKAFFKQLDLLILRAAEIAYSSPAKNIKKKEEP